MRFPASALTGIFLLAPLCGCGGAKPSPAQVPDGPTPAAAAKQATPAKDPPADDDAKAADDAPNTMPTKCAKAGDVCTPSSKFVNKLCGGDFPDATLYLFSKASPFTHGYLTRKTKAWNASGGASESGWVAFDEEVVILRARTADKNGMQVSGAGGGYDALRWDGSCVTLAKEEVTLSKPPAPKFAKVTFRELEDSTQDALRKDDAVTKAYRDRRKYCKGATMGEVSLKCVKADAKLSEVIVDFVRNGGTLPVPQHIP